MYVYYLDQPLLQSMLKKYPDMSAQAWMHVWSKWELYTGQHISYKHGAVDMYTERFHDLVI